MAAKRIRVSSDDITYYTLPGNTGEIQNEAGQIEDTIFGQTYKSNDSGLITWMVNANAIYKGFVGYRCEIKAATASTAFTDEAFALVSGKTYRITNAAKNCWDPATVVTVEDNGVAVDDADIESIDYLFGRIIFDAGYTVTGPVTASGANYTLAMLAGYKEFTLTQTEDAIDTTTIPVAQGNDGHSTFTGDGLKTVSLELSGLYASANGYRDALVDRETVVVELNPDGNDKSRCRGYFKYVTQGQQGDVGALEEENVTLNLNVPDVDLLTAPLIWDHASDTTLNQGVRKLLDAWTNATLIYVQYLPDGTNGVKGQAAVTDMTLQGGLESMNEFTVSLQGSGALSAVP
jgi:predicted secreted protein